MLAETPAKIPGINNIGKIEINKKMTYFVFDSM